jgi:hypothetical protein
MEIEGIPPGKDFKLWPGGGRPWDWIETGTHHSPGVRPADVEELVEHGAEVVVLSRGRELALEVSAEALDWLQGRNVAVHVEETEAAVNRYNELAERGEQVGGLFHSTC